MHLSYLYKMAHYTHVMYDMCMIHDSLSLEMNDPRHCRPFVGFLWFASRTQSSVFFLLHPFSVVSNNDRNMNNNQSNILD